MLTDEHSTSGTDMDNNLEKIEEILKIISMKKGEQSTDITIKKAMTAIVLS